MAVTLQTKLDWFDRGALAFERTFPGEIAARFGAGAPPMYVCPLCDVAFERTAVLSKDLTAEHVPLSSFQGRELLLTCGRCNHTAGTRVDAHARSRERVIEAVQGVPTGPMKVSMTLKGQTVRGHLRVSEGGWLLHVVEKVNSPAALAAFKAAGPPKKGDTFQVQFAGDRFNQASANISFLRAGFLALFASVGYRFTFDPAIEIVKRQLRDPEHVLIPTFSLDIPKKRPWAKWLIVEIPTPRCTGVMFGRFVVLFPNRGDLAFYDRVAAEAEKQTRGHGVPVQVTAQSYELVGGPRFGLVELPS